jgi:NADH-quinone oxidoreductase subunit D
MSSTQQDPYASTKGVHEGTGSSTSPARTGTASSPAQRRAATSGIVVNMGPQHPSTHGVLRLILELDGEMVTEARCGIGYLHTGIEKNMEYRNWTQGVTFCTRMDYLSPFHYEAVYSMASSGCSGSRSRSRRRRR